jgi:hypothetical protein
MTTTGLRREVSALLFAISVVVSLVALLDTLLFVFGLIWRALLMLAGMLTFWSLPVCGVLLLLGVIPSAVLYHWDKEKTDLLSFRLFVGSISIVICEAVMIWLINVIAPDFLGLRGLG